MRLPRFPKTPSPTSAALTARLAGFGVFQKQLRRTSPFDVAPTAHLRRPLKIPPPPHLRLRPAVSSFFRGDSGSRLRFPKRRLNAYVTP